MGEVIAEVAPVDGNIRFRVFGNDRILTGDPAAVLEYLPEHFVSRRLRDGMRPADRAQGENLAAEEFARLPSKNPNSPKR